MNSTRSNLGAAVRRHFVEASGYSNLCDEDFAAGPFHRTGSLGVCTGESAHCGHDKHWNGGQKSLRRNLRRKGAVEKRKSRLPEVSTKESIPESVPPETFTGDDDLRWCSYCGGPTACPTCGGCSGACSCPETFEEYYSAMYPSLP